MPDLKTRLHEYGDVLENAAPPVTSDEIAGRLETPRQSRRGWQHPVIVAGAAGVLVALVVGGVSLLTGDQEQPAATTTPTPTTLVTPTTVPSTPSTTLPSPSGDVVPLTPDQQEVAGILLEAAETLGEAELELEIEDDAGIENDGVGAAGRASSIDANGHAMSVGLIKFKSVDAAVAYLDLAHRGFQVGLGGLQQSSPDPAYTDQIPVPLPEGWDQTVGFTGEGGRGPAPIFYWARNGVWVIERSIVVFEGGGNNAYDDAAQGLADTQARVDAIFGAVETSHTPAITVYFEPPPPPVLPDVYTIDFLIDAPHPDNREDDGEDEWRGLGWRFGYTHGGSLSGTCDTWHVPFGEIEPTVVAVYGPQADRSDPQYLAALDQCTKYPGDAASWGLAVPEPRPDLGALTPTRISEGEYIATVATSPRPHEEELSESQVYALGIISDDSNLGVLEAMVSIRTDGLVSIYLTLRGTTAEFREEFGLDFSDLGSGAIDVEVSIEAFPGDRD